MRATVTALTSSLRLMWRACRSLLLAVVSLDVLSSVAQAITLVAAGWVLGRLAESPSFGEVLPGVLGASAGIAINLAATAIRNDLSELASDRTRAETSAAVLRAAGRMPYRAFDDPTFYDGLRRAHEGGSQHVWRVVSSSFGLLRSTIELATTMAVLLVVVPLVIPVALTAYLPLAVVSARNNRMLHRLSWGLTADDRRLAYLDQIFADRAMAKEIRTLGLQTPLGRRHQEIWSRRMDAVYGLARTRATRSVAAQLLSACVVGAALGIVVALTTSGTLSLAAASVGVLGVRQLANATGRAGRESAALHRSALFLDDYEKFIANAAAIEVDAAHAIPEVSSITFDSVSFRYPGSDRDALRNISLTIERGQVTAVVGGNGAGKSTLIGLLCGLYRPAQGAILWDGHDTAAWPETSIQRSSSVLFQDFGRLEFTIADSIAPAGTVDRATLERAASRAGVDDHINTLEDGFDHQLGRQFDGAELSGGQWQRLALARSLAAEAALLVLDEPGAAMDVEGERRLVELARQEARRRPVVFVSHRFGSVREADTIVVLEEGTIIEVGDHDTLMSLDGRYAKLFQLQASAFQDKPDQASRA